MNRKKTTLSPESQQGAAAIEFAFILPVLLLIFTGMIEYGRVMWHYDVLAKAARDAARYLSSVPASALGGEASSSTSTARSIVANAATQAGVVVTGLDPLAYITITCSPAACTSPASGSGSTVTVAINYPYVIGGWLPVFGATPADAPAVITAALAPYATMPYMQ